jgi:hypothetical protein
MIENINKQDEQEQLFPHSPDVKERLTSDEGFSAGWGMHFKPVEKCWLDIHTHIRKECFNNLDEIIRNFIFFIKE